MSTERGGVGGTRQVPQGVWTTTWGLVLLLVLLPLVGLQAHEHESQPDAAETCAYCAAATMPSAPSPEVERVGGGPPPSSFDEPDLHSGPRPRLTDPRDPRSTGSSGASVLTCFSQPARAGAHRTYGARRGTASHGVSQCSIKCFDVSSRRGPWARR